MLVPSYSEALLMEPAPAATRSIVSEEPDMEMVPSYSEALLYERAYDLQGEVTVEQCPDVGNPSTSCVCPCHRVEECQIVGSESQTDDASSRNCDSCAESSSNCNDESNQSETGGRVSDRLIGGGSGRSSMEVLGQPEPVERRHMPRENSEPNLRTNSELFSSNMLFARGTAGHSLENILEHDETDGENAGGYQTRNSSRAEALILEDDTYESLPVAEQPPLKHASRGAIPKKIDFPVPVQERAKKIPSSRTYFCIKSILKQHRRRYTLVTPEELQNLVGTDQNDQASTSRSCNPHCCGAHWERIDVNSNTLDNVRGTQVFQGSLDSLSQPGDSSMQKRDSSRTLIFASPIQEICPSDPFGGRTLVPSENPPDYEDALDLPVLSRLKRSFTERETRNTGSNVKKHHRTFSIEPEYLFSGNRGVERRCQGDGMPYDVVIPVQNSRIIMPSQYRRAFSEDGATGSSSSTCCVQESEVDASGRLSRLTRSMTERNSTRRNTDRYFRRSLTDRIEFSRNGSRKITNINMETSL